VYRPLPRYQPPPRAAAAAGQHSDDQRPQHPLAGASTPAHRTGRPGGGPPLDDQGGLAGRGTAHDDGVGVVGRQVGEHGPHLGQERPGVDRTRRRVTAGGAHDELVDGGRYPVDHRAGRRDVFVDVPVGHRQRAVGLVGRDAGEQLPQHDAGRVDVGAGVGAAVDHLLGRQVGHGAEQQPGGGGERGGLDRTRQPEVGDLHAPVGGHQQVLGLDVAVHQPGGVRRRQRAQDRLHQGQCLPGRQRALFAQQRPDGAAGDVLHDQVGGAGGGVLALVEDPDDIGARQPGGGAGLAGEALDELGVVGQHRPHHLDGDDPVEPGVGGQVDRGHAAARDGGVEPVAAVEQPADQRIRQRRPGARLGGDGGVHGR
jgi:hypothetical protein